MNNFEETLFRLLFFNFKISYNKCIEDDLELEIESEFKKIKFYLTLFGELTELEKELFKLNE
jgi:hypothetical protein